MVPLLLRYGSEILTDPQVLKAFSAVLQDTGLDITKRSAYASALGRPETTKESLKPFTISKENQKILLDWANTTLPTEEDLEQMDFVNKVEESILSLMKEPQKSVESRAAREDQMRLMDRLNPRSPQYLSPRDAAMGNIIQDKLQPTFQANLGAGQPQVASGKLSPDVRSDLAFGGLDEALETQMFKRGIGGL